MVGYNLAILPMTHDHSHALELTRSTRRRLTLSLSITLAFVVVEIFAGVFSNSLALLTDAAHNFTDVIALALSWWAMWVTTKPAHARKTYGYHRAGILVALINSTSLVLIAMGIFYEGWKRLITPPEVQAGILISVGVIAVIVNLATALLVRRGSDHDLNLRSAFLHLMGDVISTVGAVIAGVIIHFTGWNWLDAVISILIGFLILWNAWGILRESLDILMEATPSDIDMDGLTRNVLEVKGVLGVHDLHVWSITRSLRSLSAHLVTEDNSISVGSIIQAAVGEMLEREYGISHITLQLECADCTPADLYCDFTHIQ
jgi:cobalt-zinc-cadmium efflux system protein